jgi:hypothetical protein
MMITRYVIQSRVLGILLAAVLFALTSGATAVPYYYVDWTAWNPAGGTAVGTITPSSGPGVTVTFDALTSSGAHGSYLGVTGSSLWLPETTYQSSEVDNAPGYEGLQLVGESNMTYRVTLSEPIKDPIMAVATLGSAGDSATYVFDSPFTILSQGVSCCWGGTDTSLQQLPGNVLQGKEGSGIIQFIGTYSTFSWTVPDPEFWHGFTFGIRTTQRLEPPTVPLPAAFALMNIGLGVIGFAGYRNTRKFRAR